MTEEESPQHVVVFARRFSVNSLSSPPCVVATSPSLPPVPSLQVATIPQKDPISVELVNINRLYSSSDIQKRREDFRRKYETKGLAIDIDVCKLNPPPPPPKEDGFKPKKSSAHSSRRMSQTISFDEYGRVIRQEFVQSESVLSEESSVYDEDDDPFNDDFDFGDAFRLSESPEPQDKESQTHFVNLTISVLTQTPTNDLSTSSCQTAKVRQVDSGIQVEPPPQNDLNKFPNIVVTPPAGKLNNFIVKPPSIFSQKTDSTGQNSFVPQKSEAVGGNGKKSRLKRMVSDFHSKYVDKTAPEKQLNQNNVDKPSKPTDLPNKKSTKSIKQLFESKKKNVETSSSKPELSDKLKHELRNSKTSVKNQIGAISAKEEEEIPLLEQLLKEIANLPLYKLIEFEKGFVKSITDRELLEIVKTRFRHKSDQQLIDIMKELVKNIDVDDMYDIFEQYVNERPYSECKILSMKICENLLNKKDLTEFMMRNFSSMSENNKKVLATSLLEDLPYESMKKVIELQLPKLKEKDIPNVLNNIQTDPNKREFEKAVSILSSKLSGDETQKLIRDLGRGMKHEEIAKAIKHLFDYLPKRESESLARRYVEVKKVMVERWTETKAIEVRSKLVSKQTGTDPPKQEIKEARAEKSRKVVVLQGESWFANDRRCVNRMTQTDAVNRLLFKDKTDLQNAAETMNKAKKRFLEKSKDSKSRSNREDVMIGGKSSRTPTPNSLALSSAVETDGGRRSSPSSPALMSPALISPALMSPGLISPGLMSPSITSPAPVTVSTRYGYLHSQFIYNSTFDLFNGHILIS